MPRPVHFEVPADDPDRLIAFYRDVFGWEIHKWDGPMDYWLVVTGESGTPGIDGGIARRQPGATVAMSLDVPSVDEYAGKIESAGGAIIVPKMAVPGVGWLAYFKDTEGNVFGIMEEDESAK